MVFIFNPSDENSPVNPYHYALHCIGGKWKMTILHEIYTFGKIRFNQTLKQLPISEKVLAQQLRELMRDGHKGHRHRCRQFCRS